MTDSLSSFVPRHDVSFLSLLYLLTTASHTTLYFLFSPLFGIIPHHPTSGRSSQYILRWRERKRERVNLQVDVFFPFSLHKTGGWQAAGHWGPADQSQLSRQHVQTRKGITNKRRRRRRRRLILSRLQVNGQVGPRERERDGPAPRL